MNIGFHRFVGFPQKLIDPNCSYVVILFYGAYCCLEIDCNTRPHICSQCCTIWENKVANANLRFIKFQNRILYWLLKLSPIGMFCATLYEQSTCYGIGKGSVISCLFLKFSVMCYKISTWYISTTCWILAPGVGLEPTGPGGHQLALTLQISRLTPFRVIDLPSLGTPAIF